MSVIDDFIVILIKNNVLETLFGRSSDPNYSESPFFHESD